MMIVNVGTDRRMSFVPHDFPDIARKTAAALTNDPKTAYAFAVPVTKGKLA